MNLTINPINNNQVKPSFGKKVYRFYSDMKHLPGLQCACCGKDVFNGSESRKAFMAVAKPLKQLLESGAFQRWDNYSRIMTVLANFVKQDTKNNLDTILEDENSQNTLRKAVEDDLKEKVANGELDFGNKTGFIKAKNNEYLEVLQYSRANLKSASVVMKRFANFKNILKGSKLETFEQLEIYARKYPRKSLQEIINQEEVYRFHQQKDLLQRASTREKMDYHFDNILLMVKKQNPAAVQTFEDLKLDAIDLLEKEFDAEARIPKMKKMYEKALKENGLEKLISKVNTELDQVPITFITSDSFLVFAKNHGYNDGQIISSLINPQMASIEHIVPSSAGGQDIAENSLVLCRGCNRARAATPYTEFLQYHPMMPYHTQKQIMKISEYILNGTFEIDKFWPIKVSKTLSDYTNGKLFPDVSEYCKKQVRRTEKLVKERNEAMGNLKKERVESLKKKAELENEINEVNSKLSILSNCSRDLNRSNQLDTNDINKFKKEIKK